MSINVNLDDIIKVFAEMIKKVEFIYFIVFITVISSFNLWFLSIYFFDPDFIKYHGLTIALLTTFTFTVSWFVLATMTVPKYIIGRRIKNNKESTEDSDKIILLLICIEIILLQSFFSYINYIFHFKSFKVFVSIAFGEAILQYIFAHFYYKRALKIKNKTSQ